MSAPATTRRPFAEQHALNRRAVARLWVALRFSGALEIIETDRDGNPVMSPPPDLDHDIRKDRIAKALQRLLPEGEAFVETAVSTFEGAKVPDACWIRAERREQLLSVPRGERLSPIAPEVCVEVLSPDNSRSGIDSNQSAYFGVGVREVWICDRDATMSFYGPQGRLERSAICPEVPRQVPAGG
ncbi:MAG: Uma2 family endonuclease [Verrucomicrobia bacterium]|nr:Uma2 family endonuclease [Verrucomicrobiota bacterium]